MNSNSTLSKSTVVANEILILITLVAVIFQVADKHEVLAVARTVYAVATVVSFVLAISQVRARKTDSIVIRNYWARNSIANLFGAVSIMIIGPVSLWLLVPLVIFAMHCWPLYSMFATRGLSR